MFFPRTLTLIIVKQQMMMIKLQQKGESNLTQLNYLFLYLFLEKKRERRKEFFMFFKYFDKILVY